MTRRLGPDLLAAGLLVLFTVSCLWPVAAMQAVVIQNDVTTSDLNNDRLPSRAYLGQALKRGEFPLWTPEIYAGYPFLAGVEVGACYPLNLLLYGTLPLLVGHNLSILLPFVIAGIGLYAYCRQIGLDRIAALLAGLSFSFSGFFVCHVKQMNMVDAACWVPVILLCLERALRRDRAVWVLWAGVVFGVQILAGHPQITYYTGLVSVVYLLVRLFQTAGTRPFRARVACWFLVAMLLGAGLGAVQLLPTYELTTLSRRSGGIDFEFATRFPYAPRDALTFVVPYANGDPGRMTYQGTLFWENYGYAGLLPLLLAAVGIALGVRREGLVRFHAVAGGVAYLLVLGKWTPLFKLLFYTVPGLAYFRFPTRFMLFVELAIAVLAAFGWTALCRLLSRRRSRGFVLSFVGAAVVLVTAFDLRHHQVRQIPVAPADAWLATPAIAQAIRRDPDRGRLLTLGGAESHVLAYRAAGGWEGDVTPYVRQRELLQPSSNLLHGVATVDGYINLVPTYLASVWGEAAFEAGLLARTLSLREDGRLAISTAFLRLASLSHVAYVASLWPIDDPGLTPIPVGNGPFHLYANPYVMPRAHVVGGYLLAADEKEAGRLLLSPAYDPEREVILLDRPEGIAERGPAHGTAEIETARAHEVVVRVDSSDDGILVLADTYYPGWQAEVDGRPVPILRANVTQRAVVVGAGEHVVRFRFRSRPVRLGLTVTLASAVLFVAAFLLGARMDRGGRTDPATARADDRITA